MFAHTRKIGVEYLVNSTHNMVITIHGRKQRARIYIRNSVHVINYPRKCWSWYRAVLLLLTSTSSLKVMLSCSFASLTHFLMINDITFGLRNTFESHHRGEFSLFQKFNFLISSRMNGSLFIMGLRFNLWRASII